jgi:photosystem II stability/assembly factor-like uncharacterized protein/tetratricopeptide (TPR) repeat protein
MRPEPTVPAPLRLLPLLAAALLAPAARAGEPRFFDDAALHAVQFVDANEGWAVGDEGVILHSIDGGKTWERQVTGVRASLRSVHFLNPYTGWVAGREELPGGGSAGVLLYTQDGGVAWTRLLANSLPALNFVHFASDKVGYLAGDGCEQVPTGVLVTEDSGRTWKPVSGPRVPSWLCGAFAGDRAALGGAWNRLATVRPDRLSAADIDSLGGRAVRGMHFAASRGVAVGQGGLVLTGAGAGAARWDFAELPVSPEARASCDFHAVHGVGDHVWAVGRPGAAVLHSGDGGATWEFQATKQPLPLNGVCFIDEKNGWAVGELGTILHTADGGKTWSSQARGGQRAAVLLLHAESPGTPLDAVALLGGQEGYLAAAVRVVSPDPSSAAPGRAADGFRYAAAVRRAGGASGETLWQFPLAAHQLRGNRDDLMRHWDGLHGGHAAENMLRQLVLAIRVWRPDVILTDAADGSPLEALLAEAVREAVLHSGDPKVFPEQLTTLSLEPWQPTKLYGCIAGKSEPTVALDLTAVSKRLETSVGEFAASAAALLDERPAPVPLSRGFRLVAGPRGAAAQRHNLMEGVVAEVGVSRRALPLKEEDLPAGVEEAVRRRATLQALAQGGGLCEPDRLLAQILPMLENMPDDQAARAAHGVAGQFARQGQWGLAREVYTLLADRYPAHPLAADAYRWLIRYNTSSEARRRLELGQFVLFRDQAFNVPAGKQSLPMRPPGATELDQDPKSDKVPHIETPRLIAPRQETRLTLTNPDQARQWYQGSLELAKKLAAFGPLYATDPATQFCLQSARRNLGDFETPKQWYREFARQQPDGPWRSAAQAELWLTERADTCPKPVATSRFTETRPFLDGKLDDPCWQAAPALKLTNAAGDTLGECPTEVRLAYDQEYLYIAARCGHAGGRSVTPVKGRSHDMDLSKHDRLSIVLDLDRDYSTYFHLQIDERGCTAEDCWGDKSWDPRWYVAVNHEEKAWTVEAAIPLSALTGDGVSPGRAWCFNAVRVLPGQGVQAFSLPAEVPEEAMRPEGWGLLLFVQEGRRTAQSLQAMPPAQ